MEIDYNVTDTNGLVNCISSHPMYTSAGASNAKSAFVVASKDLYIAQRTFRDAKHTMHHVETDRSFNPGRGDCPSCERTCSSKYNVKDNGIIRKSRCICNCNLSCYYCVYASKPQCMMCGDPSSICCCQQPNG